MADYQVIGDKSNLGKTPQGSPSANSKPAITQQIIGTAVPLNRTIHPSPSSLQSKGEYCVIGTQVQLSTTPNKTVGNSSSLKVSEMAQAASQVGPIPSAKVTRP